MVKSKTIFTTVSLKALSSPRFSALEDLRHDVRGEGRSVLASLSLCVSDLHQTHRNHSRVAHLERKQKDHEIGAEGRAYGELRQLKNVFK